MSFTTTDNVKMFLNKETLTPFEEYQINLLIPMADGIIEDYCGRPAQMLASDYVLSPYKGTGTEELNLRIWPINEVAAVLLDDEDITAACELDPANGVLTYVGSTFPLSSRIKVSFNGGYSSTNIPGGLSYAATFLVATNFHRIAEGQLGLVEGKFDQTAFKLDSTDLPKIVTNQLERHRKLSIY